MNLIKNLVIISSIILTSCTINNSTPSPMPVEPIWTSFSSQPIKEKIEDDYLVTKEFILKCEQEHDYVERVRQWKIQNSIP